MNQQEAAKFLEVSDRMLRIYTNQGRIAATEDKSAHRRTLVYIEEDLRQLKAELTKGKRWKLPKPEQATTEHIGFRLDQYYKEKLSRAAERRGMSVGEYARQIIIDALEHRHEAELKELRKDLAHVTYAILAYAGKVSPDEAESWVSENLEHQEENKE